MNPENGVAAFVPSNAHETELELVRRGFDPAQVQSLVGSLAGELKTVSVENERLKARVTELEQTPRPAAEGDIFAHWSNETNALMDAARASIARVTEQATNDAASAVSAGEVAATTIRQRAQIDAEALLADARKQAEATLAEARQQSELTIAEAEAAKAAIEAESEAELEKSMAKLATTEAKINELKAQRSTIKDQLTNAQTHIQELLSLVHAADDTETASDAPATTEATAAVTTASTVTDESENAQS